MKIPPEISKFLTFELHQGFCAVEIHLPLDYFDVGSPEPLHRISIEGLVIAHRTHSLRDSLGDQQTVEGVAVVMWERQNMSGMLKFNCKKTDSVLFEQRPK